MGIHHPHVRRVLLYGDTFTMIDFVQMAARAGRDGQRAEVTLYPFETHFEDAEPDWIEFKTTTDCRRSVVSRSIDGVVISCCALPDAALCDNCQGGYGQRTEARTLRERVQVSLPKAFDHTMASTATRLVEALFDAIEYLEYGCRYCTLRGLAANHPPDECPTGLHTSFARLQAGLNKVRTARKVEPLLICKGCHMPQQCQIPGVMDRHLRHFQGEYDDPCTLRASSIGSILALVGSPLHAEKILSIVPMRDPSVLLDALYEPWLEYPCPPRDRERQLVHLHFLLLAAVAESPTCPRSVTAVAEEPWFAPWRVKGEPQDLLAAILAGVPEMSAWEEDPRGGDVDDVCDWVAPQGEVPMGEDVYGEQDVRDWFSPQDLLAPAVMGGVVYDEDDVRDWFV